MMYTKFILVGLIFLFEKSVGQEATFDYGLRGPDTWPVLFRTSCGGNRQSPIDINSDELVHNPRLKRFNFNNYETAQTYTFSFGPETSLITLTPPDGSAVGISGSDLGRTNIRLTQIVFHYGLNEFQGSEHRINGKKFPLEMQLVHRSGTKTVILSFLFELSATDNAVLEPLITTVLDEVDLADFRLSSILPTTSTLDAYVKYTGSLTQPNCDQGVTWYIFRSKIRISRAQLENFWKEEVPFCFRDPQPLNDRIVHYSKITSSNYDDYYDYYDYYYYY